MISNLNGILKSVLYLLISYNIVTADDQWLDDSTNNAANWDGPWFPHGPGARDNNPSIHLKEDLYDPKHGVKMGVPDPSCDDGKIRLEVDWDFNPINYTCFDFNGRDRYQPRGDIPALYAEQHIPEGYSAPHKCMNQSIEYEDIIPTFGTHRPVWAKWGEYTFLPRQRWLHNLEHGAVVMLYHPCADKNEVNDLRRLVTGCLYRHIITPFNLLSPERPLALVTWGHRIEISKVAPEIVLDFIKQHALRGPEQTPKDGQYDVYLAEHAKIVSDIDDHGLCKLYDFVQ